MLLRKKYFLILVLIVGITAIAVMLINTKGLTLNAVLSCAKSKELLANEAEMKNIFPEGTAYQFLEDYQKCNPLKRGDIVVVEKGSKNTEGQSTLLPRVLRASPGDFIEVFPAPIYKGFSLKINGEMLYDLEGKKPHIFVPGQWGLPGGRMHELFKKSSFTLGPDEYLVFSSISPSFNDSSTWGPIHGLQIKGRAVKKE